MMPLLAQAEPVAHKSLLEHIHSGGVIGYLIIVMSVVAVALFFVALYQLRAKRLAPPDVVAGLDRMLREGDTAGALAFTRDEANDCFLSKVIGAALTRCTRSAFGFLELRTALEEAGQEQVSRLMRSTDAVGLIATIAPMLGLLGTVVGMVGAFETINTSGGFARPDQLAGDISVALITTVLGLVVAIPATFAHSHLRNRIEALAADIGQITEELSAHLESAPAESGRPAARPPARTGAA